MKYFSTRDKEIKVTASQAIAQGLAIDGGLFVPEYLPKLGQSDIDKLRKMDYRQRACFVMKMFLDEFETHELDRFVGEAYSENFDSRLIAPLRFIEDGTAFLELWHGPTCAFKDMALQMLPHLLTASLVKCGEKRQVCILVATSGDTGKAALEGFCDVEGTRIFVFYPKDGVSDVQKLQMVTQEGKNVLVSAVNGNFDDAQTGVKKIFGDRDFAAELNDRGYFLSSANSINWGRLLPQIVYYISAYCDLLNGGRLETGDCVNFCVPTGNFGNILAGWYAKSMGLPVNKFICASNENNVLTDFIETGVYDKNRDFHVTVSPSMDILVSSNLERLLFALSGNDKEVSGYMSSLRTNGKYSVSLDIKKALDSDFAAGYCSDEETKAQIKDLFDNSGYLIDTHTAVAYKVLRDYRERTCDLTPSVVVSTASPFKFCDSVLLALGEEADGSGAELIARLEKRAELNAPEPLKNIGMRDIRFTGCVEKSEMKSAVDAFLA